MRENAATHIIGQRVRLVPYLPEHVETYHGWMQDEEMLRLTGSEPLTLEEEQHNQQSWLQDPKKVTFIICARSASSTDDVTAGMCGDVNAFLWEEDVDEPEGAAEDAGGAGAAASPSTRLCAELEVMVADPKWRRHGLAREALLLLMHWLHGHVPQIAWLVVKIEDDNMPSRRLFEALGFAVHKHLTVFQQTEMRMGVEAAWRASEAYWTEVGAEVVCVQQKEEQSQPEPEPQQPQPP